MQKRASAAKAVRDLQIAAGDGAQYRREGKQGAGLRDHAGAFGRIIGIADDGTGDHDCGATADRLDEAGEDEDRQARRHAAGDRGRKIDSQSGQQYGTTSVAVR